MIVYSSHPKWNESTLNSFQRYSNQKLIFLDNLTSFSKLEPDQCRELICFIPLFGDEELNEVWINFFQVLGLNPSFIGYKVFIFTCGTNEPLDENCPLLKQIYFYTRFLSLDYHIFPFKLHKKSKVNFSTLLEFYLQSKSDKNQSSYLKIINNLVFYSKDHLIKVADDLTDSTSKLNEFNSVLFEVENKGFFVKSLIEECTSESLLINRAKLEDKHFSLEKENPNLKRLHLISNKITDVPDLSLISNLKTLNLSANNINNALLTEKKLPLSLEVINLSKNLISSVKVNNEFPSLRSFILFNNPLISFDLSANLFPKLKHLNIGWIKSLNKIPDFVFSLENLESICLSYLSIDCFDERILEIKKLSYIDIRGIEIKKGKISVFKKNLIKKGIRVVC